MRAERAGTAVFGDAHDWIGKSVAVGERILLLADPAAVELTAWMPSGDAIDVKVGDVLTLYPQGDPFNAYRAVVQTVVESTATDPHEFEPTPADTAKLTNADLVVVNGLGYDEWATKAADAASPQPAVVDAAEATGRTEGSNPHVWYDPAAQQKVAGAVTGALTKLQPEAATYLQSRSSIWAKDQVPYRQAVDRTSMVAKGRTYAATEPVAEYLADALGMTDVTPKGFAQAAANETEPSPGDVTELLEALRTGKVDVLLVNSQVEGQLNRQLVAAAKAADVAVLTVTETQPPGTTGFVKWQVFQLDELAGALQTPPS